MNRYTLILSAAVLTVFSFGAGADVKSDEERQAGLHTAMGAQARGTKDFGMAAHCTRLAQKYRAEAAAHRAEAAAGR